MPPAWCPPINGHPIAIMAAGEDIARHVPIPRALPSPKPKRKPSPHEHITALPAVAVFIVRLVARQWDVAVEDIMSRRQHKRVAAARGAAMFLLRERGHSYSELGCYFGRDHSTAMAAVRVVAKRQASSSQYAEVLRQLSARVPHADPVGLSEAEARRAWPVLELDLAKVLP